MPRPRISPDPVGLSAGLWNERDQDACGIGFIADIAGVRRHRVLALALEALANLCHRGATGADGRTSDGTGLLTQIPWFLLRKELRLGSSWDEADLAVAVFFLPADAGPGTDLGKSCRRRIEDELCGSGLELLAWRPVPVEKDVLGEQARSTCPVILQAVLGRRDPAVGGVERGDAFERRLLLARKRLENRIRVEGPEDLVVVSMSHRTLVYKSMALANELGDFYPDLRRPDFHTAVALFHQRFSTNTWPTWGLAQPFRMLAHNGEINTIQGNLHWMRTREPQLESSLWGEDLRDLFPILDGRASDSAMLDQMLEMLVLSGRHPLHAMMMLLPEASREVSEKLPELRAFYDFHATLLEPWDGPAAVVFSDGRVAAAALDRNGLRPQRYWRTDDGLMIVGSEAGMVRLPEARVVEKGRLGPGQVLAVDMEAGRVLYNDQIKRQIATRAPYGRWLHQQLVLAPQTPSCQSPAETHRVEQGGVELGGADSSGADSSGAETSDAETSGVEHGGDVLPLQTRQEAYGYTKEALERIFDPMLRDGKLPVGSMGNDAPLAVLSAQPQLAYSYFKQRFAQVTNPPMDPIRERLVFSLDAYAGGWANLLDERPEAAHLVRFGSPILSTSQFRWLAQLEDPAFRTHRLEAVWEVEDDVDGLARALELLKAEAEQAVDDGATVLVLDDLDISAARAPIPMLLATAAVHSHLVRAQKRMRVTLVCDTGEPREDHHFACLIGYGASLVHPRLALETVVDRAATLGLDPDRASRNYLSALDKGLLKVLSRLGVGPIASYHGARLFEALGLDAELVEDLFEGTASRVGGVGPRVLAADALALHAEAFGSESVGGGKGLRDRGYFRFRKGGEHHDFNPMVFKSLHRAVRTGSTEAFRDYSDSVDRGRPTRLRDLLSWRRSKTPIPLEEVEPAEEIARRFCTAAMSLGALSSEAHEVLAIGMNRLGARSNSGEGGEEPRRFEPYTADQGPEFSGHWSPEAGDWGNSAIKQIASGRFGVTPQYLSSAKELEIKMAQGSKPGEGGQIPGKKVTPEIARLRNATPGVPLISPPPHHDIYSIEDLAQLIHDLHRINPRARVGVKLVALAGVGTIACGVAKAGADYVLISGDDGGTGASPLSSIKHAGMPWELGLAETQQRLVRSNLRGRMTVRVDGGLKTGRDIVLAALLGAEEFGFGTAPLVAIGCVMARQCHLDTCPVGVATQRQDLRKKFPGTPENVVAFMLFVAEQVRHILAEMGVERLEDIVGRFDLVETREDRAPLSGLDLGRLLVDPDPEGSMPRRWVEAPLVTVSADGLDERLWAEGRQALDADGEARLSYQICNQDRSVGARLSGELAQRARRGAAAEGQQLRVDFHGVAGQSFGVFLSPGLDFHLTGEAQDYVGKGMAGGRLVVRPDPDARFRSNEQVIAGNTLLYGATGGELYAAGRVGERFCVRNSGAKAVVEGCGDHGCEYMTAGVAVILGRAGRNFAAGMTGGRAYLLDPERTMESRLNPDMVTFGPLVDVEELAELHALLETHSRVTGSVLAQELIAEWPLSASGFLRVGPRSPAETLEMDRDALELEAKEPEQALSL